MKHSKSLKLLFILLFYIIFFSNHKNESFITNKIHIAISVDNNVRHIIYSPKNIFINIFVWKNKALDLKLLFLKLNSIDSTNIFLKLNKNIGKICL